MPTMENGKRYRWASPHEWLDHIIDTWNEDTLRAEIKTLARLLDADQIQDEYQAQMAEDGYFRPLKGRR